MTEVPASSKRIPVAAPALVGNERAYVLDCVDSTWISSNGRYIGLFEEAFAEFIGVEHAVACANGTVALHLALDALGIGPGDEVIIPSLTYVATANAVAYCGATPVFAEVRTDTWNIDPEDVARRVTSRTKAIIPVHLYGVPAEMSDIIALAEQHGLSVIEDAAEAHGATYRGVRVGSLGHLGVFSFYGNKILTTGEGGMVVTSDADLAARIKLLKGQGQDPSRRYWFPVRGYNYRMTNIEAAIGLAQLERVDWHLEQRRRIAGQYSSVLGDIDGLYLQRVPSECEGVHWMFSVVLSNGLATMRDQVMESLDGDGIETRPFFHPVHDLPMYRDGATHLPVTETLSAGGINLPSGGQLTAEEIAFVCDRLTNVVSEIRR